jgi:hypothetical protein
MFKQTEHYRLFCIGQFTLSIPKLSYTKSERFFQVRLERTWNYHGWSRSLLCFTW